MEPGLASSRWPVRPGSTPLSLPSDHMSHFFLRNSTGGVSDAFRRDHASRLVQQARRSIGVRPPARRQLTKIPNRASPCCLTRASPVQRSPEPPGRPRGSAPQPRSVRLAAGQLRPAGASRPGASCTTAIPTPSQAARTAGISPTRRRRHPHGHAAPAPPREVGRRRDPRRRARLRGRPAMPTVPAPIARTSGAPQR